MTDSADAPPPSEPPETRPFRGVIDGIVGGQLSGWAVDEFGEPCPLWVSVNGQAPALSMVSTLPRPDLAAQRISRGGGGWSFDISHLLQGGRVRIEATLPDRSHLKGSRGWFADRPAEAGTPAPAAFHYHSALDEAQLGALIGWSARSDGIACPVLLRVNDATPIEVPAANPRPDLAAKGITQGDGGWNIDLRAHLQPGDNVVRLTLPDGSDVAGTPLAFHVAPPAPVVAEPAAAVPAQPAAIPVVASVEPSPSAPPAPERSREPEAAVEEVVPAEPEPVTPAESGPAVMPSLAELDELSIDDLVLAVAAGHVALPDPARDAPAAANVADDKEDVAVQPEPVPVEPTRRRSFFSRLRGRS